MEFIDIPIQFCSKVHKTIKLIIRILTQLPKKNCFFHNEHLNNINYKNTNMKL